MSTSGNPPLVRQNSASDPFRLLTDDHNVIRRLFTEFQAATAPADRKRIASELAQEIVSHASIEEQYVHELYHRHLGPEGQRFFDDSLKADQTNIDALSVLEHSNFESDAARVDDAMRKLMDSECLRNFPVSRRPAAVQIAHMRDEEELYFPRLSVQMGESELTTLYDMLVRAKQRAPTHAHPSRPDKPTLAKITHPIAGAVDRAHDAMFGRM